MTISTSSISSPALQFGKNKKLTHRQQRAQKKAAFRRSLAQSQPVSPKHTGLFLGLAGILSFSLLPVLIGLFPPKTNGLSYEARSQDPVLSNIQPDTQVQGVRPPIIHSDVRTEFPQWR